MSTIQQSINTDTKSNMIENQSEYRPFKRGMTPQDSDVRKQHVKDWLDRFYVEKPKPGENNN